MARLVKIHVRKDGRWIEVGGVQLEDELIEALKKYADLEHAMFAAIYPEVVERGEINGT